MRIEELHQALDSLGSPADARELSEILWLACHTTPAQAAEAPAEPATTRDDLSAIKDSAGTPAPPERQAQAPTTGHPAALHPRPPEPRTGSDATEILVPTAPMLTSPLAVQRALRPLKRRVASPLRTELDEDATAARIADTALWVPVLTPSPERWLSLNLVVDTGPSMRLWRPLGRELAETILRQGAFRDVHLIYLNESGGISSSPTAPARSPTTLLDPAGRHTTLVLSDCSGPHWWNGRAPHALRRWAQTGPTAILQPLPERLWRRTAAPATPGLASLHRPGAPNTELDFTPYDGEAPDGLPIPVLEIAPRWLSGWANLVAGAGPQPTAVATPTATTAAPVHRERELPPEERVRRFLVTASPEAAELAAHVAVSIPSLPVMRLIQHRVLGESGPGQLAEVLLSGLLRPVDHSIGQYEFVPGAREALLASLPRPEAWHTRHVLEHISAEIERRAGSATETFRALLPSAQGDQALPDRPFALISPEAKTLLDRTPPQTTQGVPPPGAPHVQAPQIAAGTTTGSGNGDHLGERHAAARFPEIARLESALAELDKGVSQSAVREKLQSFVTDEASERAAASSNDLKTLAFTGPAGSGKLSAAAQLAKALASLGWIRTPQVITTDRWSPNLPRRFREARAQSCVLYLHCGGQPTGTFTSHADDDLVRMISSAGTEALIVIGGDQGRVASFLRERPQLRGRVHTTIAFDSPTSDGLWTGSLDEWRPITLGTNDEGLVKLDVMDGFVPGNGLIIDRRRSGRSEVARTFVTELALTHPPTQVTFLLADHSAGTTFTGGLEEVPHVAEAVVNIAGEPSLADRLGEALIRELDRRQSLLDEVRSAAWHHYQSSVARGAPIPPLPALFVLVNAFDELIAVKPGVQDVIRQVVERGPLLGVQLTMISTGAAPTFDHAPSWHIAASERGGRLDQGGESTTFKLLARQDVRALARVMSAHGPQAHWLMPRRPDTAADKPETDVQLRDLDLGSPQGVGGTSTLYSMTTSGEGLLYKEYRGRIAETDPDAVAKVVSFPATLPESERELLLSQTAWPVARVLDGDRITGVVMPRAPERFYRRIGPRGSESVRVRELNHLLYDRRTTEGESETPPGAGERVEIVRRITALFRLLHSHSLVVGDVSAYSILWSARPAGVYLLDCDGIRLAGTRQGRARLATPEWHDPLGFAETADLDSDRYKLALLVVRVLAGSPHLRPGDPAEFVEGVPARIAANVSDLFSHAAGPWGTRPHAEQWLAALGEQGTQG
ncbi:SAV_2336 N-terminal domain-related protein [Actinomadura rudentiformis]|uniref:FtsK domain-containing protein n=1 Tax=Actinomadura rudentiformis TaxID=359158 RepID=A0A6H9YJ47_9ACTN|nr:SAV_2336 N-terminal domain-related protein [Actinomadura rudentiformis]KAB2341277.1 hypothetical protein F8566_41895 [Actinomadura rudentiformis]